jgi:hypothetical protein
MSKPSGNGAHAPSKPAAVASLMSAYCLDLSKTPDPDARTVGYNVLLLLCLVPVVEEIKMSLSVKIFSFFFEPHVSRKLTFKKAVLFLFFDDVFRVTHSL